MDRLPNLSMMKSNTALKSIPSEEQIDKTILQICPKDDSSYSLPSKHRKKRRTTYEKFLRITYNQLVPRSILNNLPAIEDLIRSRVRYYKREYLFQIISIVAWHLRRDGGMARLYMKYIDRQVPQGNQYLIALRECEIIKRDGNYIEGLKSYEYCFCEGYQDELVEVKLNNRALIKKLEDVSYRIKKDSETSLLGHSRQRKYLRLLTIDPDFYTEFLNQCSIEDTAKKNSIRASATRITNRDFNCSRDDTSMRLHSNITNMATELRSYLRVDGKPLKNIDIKNSQPYLSILLLIHPKKVAFLAKDPALATLLKSLKGIDAEDVDRYISLVTQGQFYEYLVDEFAKRGLFSSRAETKVQVLRILFSDNNEPHKLVDRNAREIFEELFPNVHSRFSIIRGEDEGNRFQNYRRFAILMQRIESYLVLDVIMKKVYRRFPQTFVMTIHDSVITISDDKIVETVKNIMEKSLEKFVGLPARLKVE